MPTYTNPNAYDVRDGGLLFKAGVATPIPHYVPNADSLLTLTSHEPQCYPNKVIFDDVISATPITTFPRYKSVVIKNFSGDVLSLTVNDDSVNVLKIGNYEIAKIANPQLFGKVVLSGSGAGSVYIQGTTIG